MYKKEIPKIHDISFTDREIDIISCIANGQTVKDIGILLDISPNTVSTHIRNIMQKINCVSQGQILKFLEKSEQHIAVHNRYIDLILSKKFKILLKQITESKYKSKKECFIHIIHDTQASYEDIYNHLISAGIDVKVEYEQDINLKFFDNDFHIICIPTSASIDFNFDYKNVVTLLKTQEKILLQETSSSSIDNYYSAILSCIERIYDSQQIQFLIDDFKKYYNSKQKTEITVNNQEKSIKISTSKKYQYVAIILIVFIALLLSVAYVSKNYNFAAISNIHSVIDDGFFLKRDEPQLKIDEIFKKQKGVGCAILVGQGGIGKTTLAREYLYKYPSKTKYEINAETKLSAIQSLSDLTMELAGKNKKLEEEYSHIQAIQDQDLRKKRLILFVFSQLKERGDWILLFDNIDNFNELREFIPFNKDICGAGRVIITTRNNNCKNVNFLPRGSILNMEYLEKNEKEELFYKILNEEKIRSLKEQKEEVDKLLESIPSMPLDVAKAAYYLKSTGASFNEYKKIVEFPNEMSEKLQSEFIEEGSGGYDKTRYKIISMTFDKLIEANPDFKELLLLICLLDSQNIPISYLKDLKDPIVVSYFLYKLKKFSLVLFDRAEGMFSIHRSVQKLGRCYVLSLLSENEKTQFLDKIVKIMTPYRRIIWALYDNQEKQMSYKEKKTLIPHLQTLSKNIESMSKKNLEEYQVKLSFAFLLASEHEISESILRSIAKEILGKNKNYIYGYDLAVLMAQYTYFGEVFNEFIDDEKHLLECIKICEELKAYNLLAFVYSHLAMLYCEKQEFRLCNEYLLKAFSISKNLKTKALLCHQHSKIFINHYVLKKEIELDIKLIQEVLEKLGTLHFFYKEPEKHTKLPPLIGALRRRLITSYNALENYDNAIECYKESAFFYKRRREGGENTTKLETLLNIEYAYTLLRTEHINEAFNLFNNAVKIKLNSQDYENLHKAFIYRSEINIRLNKLNEAFEDCNLAIKYRKNSKTHFTQLMNITTYYNLAIISYKRGDIPSSLKYFIEFFSRSNLFCKSFLENSIYENLLSKNAFEITNCGSEIKTYLQNSLKIFSAIYGENHSFVKNYVAENCKDYSWIQQKLIILSHYVRYYFDLLTSKI